MYCVSFHDVAEADWFPIDFILDKHLVAEYESLVQSAEKNVSIVGVVLFLLNSGL